MEARLDERERGGPADAAAGAGDDGDFLHDEPFVSESGGSTSSRREAAAGSDGEKQSANVNQRLA